MHNAGADHALSGYLAQKPADSGAIWCTRRYVAEACCAAGTSRQLHQLAAYIVTSPALNGRWWAADMRVASLT